MASGIARLASIAVLLAPACAIKLKDVNEPLDNGGVTGAPADCNAIPILPKGAPGNGPAAPLLVGRFDMTDPMKPIFDWPGTYIEARFKGSAVTVILESFSDGRTKGDPGDPNAKPPRDPVPPAPFLVKPIIFAASLDGGDPQQQAMGPGSKFFTVYEPPPDDPDPVKHQQHEAGIRWVVETGLDPSVEHVIRVQRESEAVQGPVRFGGFEIADGAVLPPIVRPRRMEVIGDSITCGYGDRGANATCPFAIADTDPRGKGQDVPVSESNYLAYASIAARNLDADLVTLCFSGKGVYLNYTETSQLESSQKAAKLDENDPVHLDSKTTITGFLPLPQDPNASIPGPPARPGYYLRTRASGTQDAMFNPIVPLWDFSKEPEPQVVVINIGTNDFARDTNQDSVPDGTIDEGQFKADYKNFVTDTVRKNRKDAHIFLALPPMVTDKFPLDNTRSDMRRILNEIVNELNAAGDPKVYFIELVQMGTRYGLGCDYHPNLTVHQIMADQVAGAIRTKTCW